MSSIEGESNVASSLIWAVALIVIVGVIVGAFYYGGFLNHKEKKEIDVNISVPSR